MTFSEGMALPGAGDHSEHIPVAVAVSAENSGRSRSSQSFVTVVASSSCSVIIPEGANSCAAHKTCWRGRQAVDRSSPAFVESYTSLCFLGLSSPLSLFPLLLLFSFLCAPQHLRRLFFVFISPLLPLSQNFVPPPLPTRRQRSILRDCRETRLAA